MLDFLFEYAMVLAGEVVGEFVLESFFGFLSKLLPRNIRFGTSWRRRARREIMATRGAMKGMA